MILGIIQPINKPHTLKKMSTLLYLGTNIHFAPLQLHEVYDKEITTYIMVDSQPKCYGIFPTDDDCSNTFLDSITQIPQIFYGYILETNTRDGVYIFRHPIQNKTLKYYTNICVPKDLDRTTCPDLMDDILKTDILFIDGLELGKTVYGHLHMDNMVFVITNRSVWKSDNVIAEFPNKMLYIEYNVDDPMYPTPIDTKYIDTLKYENEYAYENFIDGNNCNVQSIKRFECYNDFIKCIKKK